MKNECNIVKDLLPLCIDGAASEDSRQLVEEHTARCEDCARERREMMLALPKQQEPQEEQAVLKKAARRLRWRQMSRSGLRTLLGLVLGILLVFGVRGVYHQLKYDSQVPVSLTAYDVRLSTLKNGELICSVVRTHSNQDFHFGYTGSYSEDGSEITLELRVTTDLFPLPGHRENVYTYNFEWRDGKIYWDGVQVTAITRNGAQGTEPVYEYGVDESRIFPASELLEEYNQLSHELQLYRDLRDRFSPLWDMIDTSTLPEALIQHDDKAINARMNEIYFRQQELLKLIPEWQ